ncbi:MAG TPA: glycosyltransferase family A protein [Acidimicrobiales bacterium]|nr:glycosyltransferase family A protein [Acidimicrobiales bacterium]
MAQQGTVSVVIPTYNRRDLVVQAVKSALAQSYEDLSCVVVDNGSTDGTREELSALGDSRVKILSEGRPLGGAGARNVGIAASRQARWVAFLDSDDLWAPDKLERQLAALEASPQALWSTTACVDIGPDLNVRNALRLTSGRAVGDKILGAMEVLDLLKEDNRLPAGNSTVLASRELLDNAGGYDAALATCDDWDLWLRLARRSPLAYLDHPLAAYRIWDGQSSSDEKAFARDAATVRARNFPGGGELPQGYVARWAREAGRRHVAAGRKGAAARSYLRAAWTGRAPGQLAYATGVLVAPGLVERRLRTIERDDRLPSGWEELVEPWLSRWRQD